MAMKPRKRREPANPSYQLWQCVRGPFSLPSEIHHCKLDDWELFDIDAAGCRLCGRLHSCTPTGPTRCRLTDNEGHQVCDVTGYCVKNLVFAKDEFVTTVSCFPTQYIAVRRVVEREQVVQWVWEILASDVAIQALQLERRKRSIRTQAIFTRLAKYYKSTKHHINIVCMCAVVQRAMQTTRVPRLLEEEDLELLVERCGHQLTNFCGLFLSQMQMPQVKLQGFVVGLLYLMRTGIQMFDSLQILPCMQELRTCLPLESQLTVLFKLSTKIVTECENLIKLAFRACSRKQLENLGFKEA